MRDKFVRELKITKHKTGDPGPPAVSQWPMFPIMSSLTDTVKQKTYVAIITWSYSTACDLMLVHSLHSTVCNFTPVTSDESILSTDGAPTEEQTSSNAAGG